MANYQDERRRRPLSPERNRYREEGWKWLLWQYIHSRIMASEGWGRGGEREGIEGAVAIVSSPRRHNFTFSSILSSSPPPLMTDTRTDAVKQLSRMHRHNFKFTERQESAWSKSMWCIGPSLPGPWSVSPEREDKSTDVQPSVTRGSRKPTLPRD